jgi:long-chain fatty acid transport protein
MKSRLRLFVVAACLGLVPLPSQAQGHLLHGVGPVNSSMGGAGTALFQDSLAALTLNPALVASVEGNQISFSTEFVEDSPEADMVLSGGAPGHAEATTEPVIQPGFGWMMRKPDGKLALGFGLVGRGGFRGDWPQDSASLLFGQPPRGLGRVHADYRVTDIPVALAYRVTPKLSLGAAFVVSYGEYSQSPLYTVADVSTSGAQWYRSAGNMDGRFAFSGRLGFVLQATPRVDLGASLGLPQHFQTHQWNSTNADPGAVEYGKPRTLAAHLDGPLVASLGAGVKLGAKTRLAVDGVYTKYDDVDGFGTPAEDGQEHLQPLGWSSVWSFKAGVEHRASEKLTVRAGYAYSQAPLREEPFAAASAVAQALSGSRFSGGFGFRVFPFLTAETALHYTPRSSVTGRVLSPPGVEAGTIELSNQALGAIMALSFAF